MKHFWTYAGESGTTLKTLTSIFSKQNGVSCKPSNAITSTQRHRCTQRFHE